MKNKRFSTKLFSKKDSFKKLAIVFMKFVPNAIPETLEIFGLNRKIYKFNNFNLFKFIVYLSK